MGLQMSLTRLNERFVLNVIGPDGDILTANESHPNWDAILKAAMNDDAAVFDYFSTAKLIEKRLVRLSTRVTVDGGTLFLDGDPLHDTLAQKIVQFVNEDVADWEPLVAFLEKVQNNPSENSRNQLFSFLAANNYDILPDGSILGYKGVHGIDENGERTYGYTTGVKPTAFQSINSGTASVNDVEQNGYIKQRVGDVVTMPRSAVDDNVGTPCSTGLHVSNFSYARTYGDMVLAISVDPRDVVSVPHDANSQKVRTCRYTILGVVGSEEFAQETYLRLDDDYADAAAEAKVEFNNVPALVSQDDEDEEDDYEDEEEEFECDDCEDAGCEYCDPDFYDSLYSN